jgi:hypothetical protein
VSFTAPMVAFTPPPPLGERTMGGGATTSTSKPPSRFHGGDTIKGGLISGGTLSRGGYYPGRAEG